MADIYQAAFIMLSICSLLFIVGLKATQHRSKRLGNLVGVLTVLLTLAYIVFLWDHAVLTRLIPYSNVIVLGNWFPIGAAILSGIACGRLSDFKKRQAFTAVGMLIVGMVGLFWPMLGSPPECGDTWQNGNCRQTSQTSCMPAACATLLSRYGIETTEKNMARLCFTRSTGTNWLGLYHGLSVKLEPEGLRPFLFDEDLEQLLAHEKPQIISCGITDAIAKKHPQYKSDWGWIPGVKHAVVLFGMDGKRILIGDPAVGLEEWALEDLRILWDGRGVRLQPLPGHPDPTQPTNMLW